MTHKQRFIFQWAMFATAAVCAFIWAVFGLGKLPAKIAVAICLIAGGVKLCTIAYKGQQRVDVVLSAFSGVVLVGVLFLTTVIGFGIPPSFYVFLVMSCSFFAGIIAMAMIIPYFKRKLEEAEALDNKDS